MPTITLRCTPATMALDGTRTVCRKLTDTAVSEDALQVQHRVGLLSRRQPSQGDGNWGRRLQLSALPGDAFLIAGHDALKERVDNVVSSC